MERLLLTGAAGSIGSVLRKKLGPLAEILRVSDINDLGDAAPNEEIVYCDLSKEDDVYKLVKGCNGIVHFGGISIEKSWSSIRPANRADFHNSNSFGSKYSMAKKPAEGSCANTSGTAFGTIALAAASDGLHGVIQQSSRSEGSELLLFFSLISGVKRHVVLDGVQGSQHEIEDADVNTTTSR